MNLPLGCEPTRCNPDRSSWPFGEEATFLAALHPEQSGPTDFLKEASLGSCSRDALRILALLQKRSRSDKVRREVFILKGNHSRIIFQYGGKICEM